MPLEKIATGHLETLDTSEEGSACMAPLNREFSILSWGESGKAEDIVKLPIKPLFYPRRPPKQHVRFHDAFLRTVASLQQCGTLCRCGT